jgi:hypothetical protein
MTEAEWLSGTDPFVMLEHLVRSGLGSERKLRLYAAACCRDRWDMLNEVGRAAVDLGERFADGEVAEETLQDAYRNVLADLADSDEQSMSEAVYGVVAVAYLEPHAPYSFRRVSRAFRCFSNSDYSPLCDVFGNPFRPTPNRDVLSPTVVTLAQAAYEDRALPNGRLMGASFLVLADALEEAGCRDSLVLRHLRQALWHYRGCWVMDWILGRS